MIDTVVTGIKEVLFHELELVKKSIEVYHKEGNERELHLAFSYIKGLQRAGELFSEILDAFVKGAKS